MTHEDEVVNFVGFIHLNVEIYEMFNRLIIIV